MFEDALESLLADVKVEGTAFEPPATETPGKAEPAESPAEPQPTTTPPPSEGGEADASTDKPGDQAQGNTPSDKPEPWNRDPRWQKLRKESLDTKAKLDEALVKLEELQSRVQSPAPQAQAQAVQIPEWFADVFGQNEALWLKFDKFSSENQKAFLEKTKQEEAAQQEASKKETERLNTWVSNSLTSIEDEHGVDLTSPTGQSLKNEFLKFIYDVKPTDEKGNIDLIGGWKHFKNFVKRDDDKAKAKRALASKVTSDVRPEQRSSDVRTAKELRTKSYHDFL